jgi:Uma2 family endonuclease
MLWARVMTSPAILPVMHAVMRDPSPEMLEERRRLGHDMLDEVWDGVLHMVPQPGTTHQSFARELFLFLNSRVREGHQIFYETALYLSPDESNYRIPDLVVASNADIAERGVEKHAELVVEVLSKNDMSRDKLPFYAECNVQEVWLVDPKTREHEIYVLRGHQYFAATPDREGTTHAPLFALDFQTIAGPKLRITAADGSVEI